MLQNNTMVDRLIALSLEEDIGGGDVTTSATVPKKKRGKAVLTAKEEFIVAGTEIFQDVFKMVDGGVRFASVVPDGKRVKPGDKVLSVIGSLSSLLTAERTALNFIQRMSGVATLANKYADALKGTSTQIVDTRKTTPGWRFLEKYAVRVGGAKNHRAGLFDGILIKDNHISAAGSIAKAVSRARKEVSHLLKIEVETETLPQVKEALKAGADIIMLDNMPLKKLQKAIEIIGGKALVEVSGNITLSSVRDVALPGVDFISSGAITHSAVFVDISMKIV